MTSAANSPLDPPAGTAALLFDCDGTLVDTLSLYRVCWRQTFGRYGFEMSDAWFAERAGNHVHAFVAMAFPDAPEADRQAITDEGMALFMSSTHLLEPLEHVVDIAQSHHGRLPMAVVSSGLGHAVHASLEAVGLDGIFDVVITLDDVPVGKPAPDCYLRALELLGVDPQACVAYEDSSTGMAAAHAAGIRTVFDVRLPGA